LTSVGRELRRKAIHIGSVAVPLVVWVAPRWAAVVLVVGAAMVALLVDGARLYARPARAVFLRRTRTLLRVGERRRITGATYLALAFAAAFFLFPLPIAVAAMLYAALGDAASAVVGRTWGRHRLRSGKSWEGVAAGFGVTLAIGLLIPSIGAVPALAGAAAATLFEAAGPWPDDNVWVALGGGAAVWAAMLL
jgi:dolichol kinase